MIVSHAHKFIFFHNPKCAGTSFREALKSYHDDESTFWGPSYSNYFRNRIDHTHLRLWEMQAQCPHVFECAVSYNSLVFVRNPYARFLSAVNEHIKKFQPKLDLSTMAPEKHIEVVEAFIRHGLTIGRIMSDWRFVHFSPQHWFLFLGPRLIPRHIVPMRPDGAFLQEAFVLLGLPERSAQSFNQSLIDLTPALASPIVTKFVEDFYADDFAYFAADQRLANLLSLEEPRPHL